MISIKKRVISFTMALSMVIFGLPSFQTTSHAAASTYIYIDDTADDNIDSEHIK